MKCPVCTTVDLVMSERAGIEIDYCPQCRGVWLDRGELDKIIERSSASSPGTSSPTPKQEWGAAPHHQHGHGEHYKSHHGKKSFWSELFD